MNEFEQAEERRKRQREEIKQKRIRQIKRTMTISFCKFFSKNIAQAANSVKVTKKNKQTANNTFLTDNGVSAEKSDVTAFTKWLEKNYSEEMDDLFPVYQKNKKITAQDIYDSFGATLHVLSDTYEGKLKDEATAAKNHIYEKKAAENGTVQITAAGDLCLEEDGYGPGTRIIIIRLEDQSMIGFLVDEVREVVNIALTDIEKPTFKLDEDNASFLAGIGKKGDTLISLLDIMAIEEEKKEA